MYADVDVKTAINRGVIPGPHMFVSTRAFSATGMYPLLGYCGLKMPEGVRLLMAPTIFAGGTRAGEIWRRLDQVLR